jgi:hypothetical protein
MALVRTDVSEESISSIITMKRISELGMLTANVSSPLIPFIVMREEIRSSETSALTRVTWRHIPEDGIIYSMFVVGNRGSCRAWSGPVYGIL